MPEKSSSMDLWTVVLGIFGLGNLLNGAWMLYDPPHWYATLPAGVPDFGPLNEHFVRDIGCIFALLGAGLVLAAFDPRWRVPATAAAAGFSILHAFVHVIDTMRGLVGPEHWSIDIPGVYAPAFILTIIALLVARQQRE